MFILFFRFCKLKKETSMINNYARGQKDNRPWGTWEVIDCGEGFCVKHILVNPDGILSLQLHHHRAEHWIIVKGTATVTLGENILTKHAGENIYIPVETKHRIQNTTREPMEFIEVQVGQNLDENDIVRYEDVYGRVK
ncbi:MAG: phosphomannose isomerase type II C-terminal cupin domain [Alphaproteobacteria bacterium]|nr:phosphomannose isomerase type II C-terminal cupin domain [Alphaproteobacteria bacterium]